ncbi:MAG TPA: response regulator [Myxococcota bacterium]|jgi:DNA-binding NtrC family response regulator
MAGEAKVLLVDDRAEARALVAGDLIEAGLAVVEARDGIEAWSRFRAEAPDLVVSDLRMPRADGIELLRRIRGISSVPVILLTAYADVATAVEVIKGGAQEFFTFPDDLARMIARARELACASASQPEADRLALLVAGRSAAMRRVRERIRALAGLSVPVLVHGEPGTGRDQVARAIHGVGGSGDAPLVTVRAGSAAPAPRIPAGAAYFLDEIGRFSAAEQAHWFERLRAAGAEAPGAPRVIACASEDLAERASQGAFHPGLAEKLQRFAILLPPLRERLEDVAQLAPLLAARIGSAMGRPGVALDRGALALLREQQWPGNVRELAGVLERLVAFSARGVITRERVREVLGESRDSVDSLRLRREAQQREELVALLAACRGNLAEVARRQNLSRGAVIYRAQKHGLLPKPRSGKGPCSP